MSDYKIEYTKQALKFLKKLPQNDRQRIFNAVKMLPYGDTKQLKGYKGIMRLRVGSYRIIYTIDNGKLLITIVDAGNRGQIYNKL